MAQTLQWLDPDRRRRRLRLLAELAGAKAERERGKPNRGTGDQIRDLIATRRRVVGGSDANGLTPRRRLAGPARPAGAIGGGQITWDPGT